MSNISPCWFRSFVSLFSLFDWIYWASLHARKTQVPTHICFRGSYVHYKYDFFVLGIGKQRQRKLFEPHSDKSTNCAARLSVMEERGTVPYRPVVRTTLTYHLPVDKKSALNYGTYLTMRSKRKDRFTRERERDDFFQVMFSYPSLLLVYQFFVTAWAKNCKPLLSLMCLHVVWSSDCEKMPSPALGRRKLEDA